MKGSWFSRLWARAFGVHRRKNLMSICPVCKCRIQRKRGYTKVEHFREAHPEYKFNIVGPSETRKHRAMLCGVCGHKVGCFPDLVRDHAHFDNKKGVHDAADPA